MLMSAIFAAAMAGLDGVQLRWLRLFSPYGSNFVQIRLVANRTQSLTELDTTPFVTLPMVFSNSHALDFKVLAAYLTVGRYYEFRLGFPYSSYTYFTNSLFVKTYDASSPFVSRVQLSSTNASITVSWVAPEYADGIVGYRLQVLYSGTGNGALTNSQWSASALKVFVLIDVPFSSTRRTITCVNGTASACLSSFTKYVVSIAVIRQVGADSPLVFNVTTAKTVVIATAKRDVAQLFLFAGAISVSFASAGAPTYAVAAPIFDTIFWPAALTNKNNDIRLNLTSSTVQTLWDGTIKIEFSEAEFASLQTMAFAVSAFSTMSFHFGDNHTIAMTYHCLLSRNLVDVVCM
jgi:hypothetical protein